MHTLFEYCSSQGKSGLNPEIRVYDLDNSQDSPSEKNAQVKLAKKVDASRTNMYCLIFFFDL